MFFTRSRLRYLIFYVTSRCNLRCRHCFYLDELNRHSEMSLDEITRVASGLHTLTFLRITGGEPLLREDLPEVIEVFYRRADTRKMGIITNGTKPERIEKMVPRIFEKCPNLSLDIGVSIDGLAAEHDDLRGLNGSFTRSRQTVQNLVRIQSQYPRLRSSLVITVTAKNASQLEMLFAELSGWGVNRLSVNHIRGKVHDLSLLEVSQERYRWFAEQCEEYHIQNESNWKAELQRAKNRLTRQTIAQVAAGEKSDIPCLAGNAIGVLYSDGEVHVCELLEGELPAVDGIQQSRPRLGNVREVEYDFYRIWHSENAENCRRWIKATRCSCTHECFLTASILFGKRNYPKLAWELGKISLIKK